MSEDTPVVQDMKIVTFTLGGHMFGIAMTSLLEIREWAEPTPLPGVPHYVRGVTNLRGNVVPVVGLSERLGWAPSETHPRSCILVINIDGKQAGLLVDEMNDIVNVNMAEIQPPPELDGADTSMIAGLVRVVERGGDDDERKSDKDEMVLLIDVPALSLTRHLDAAA
ncbi:MAG: chemotaxis protein CheW [Sphingobium sp.]|nr:purine-binding chemotaxis protein CheW [Sphingobium sp.]MCP5399380.1 purine-binding chemotaxis protein CheW [Sphingomonas sp.]